MQRFVLRLVVTALAVLVASQVFSDLVQADGFEQALVFAFVLGVVNAFLRPVLLFLTLPLTIFTLGLFTLIINALVFWVAALFPLGVSVSGFSGAFVGALTVSVVSFVASRALE